MYFGDGSAVERRPRIGGRDRAVADVVPRGRRDRRVLRDVRPARESERRRRRTSTVHVPAGHRRAGRRRRRPCRRAARLTINIEAEDPALANAAVATQVTSTLPIIVERAQYWPDPAPSWYEAHNSFGVTDDRARSGASPKAASADRAAIRPTSCWRIRTREPADVTITFLREDRHAVHRRRSPCRRRSRFNVAVGPARDVPELHERALRRGDRRPTQPIVVERAMYSNAGGVIWSAGTNATATRLPYEPGCSIGSSKKTGGEAVTLHRPFRSCLAASREGDRRPCTAGDGISLRSEASAAPPPRCYCLGPSRCPDRARPLPVPRRRG